jgi:signal transduction histidine kinase/CheY-like chemotaxis protein
MSGFGSAINRLWQFWRDPDLKASRRLTTRLLRVAVAASLVIPITLFSIASAISYRDETELADERIQRSLDVLQEQALRVFQSVSLAIDTVGQLAGSRNEAQIQTDEEGLHQQLIHIQNQLPEIQSIWLFGPSGHPEVITREFPSPKTQDYSGEDYFRVPRDQPTQGLYIGGIHASVSGGQPYFTAARARYLGGKFAGVIELSLQPSDFAGFYSRIMTSNTANFAMIRSDGTVLARFPQPQQPQPRLDENSAFHATVARSPEGGFYTTRSQIDHVVRRFGLRKLPGFPIYLAAGITTSDIRWEWMSGMAMHLIFGIPATLFLFGSLLAVLVRTERLYREHDLREAAEAAARQSQKMEAVGQLSGGIAHDFNNMLNVITASYNLIQRRIAKGDYKIDQFLQSGLEAAERAANLIQGLLAFARKQPLAPAVINPNELISGMSNLLRSSLGEQIQIETVCAGGLWKVSVDAHQLQSAILNIALNARDAMPEGGKLTIETANSYLDDAYARQNTDVEPGQYVLIALTDTGSGMTRDVAAQAFDPFFTTKPVGKGSGLGLSQVYGFIKQSRGHIKIYSEESAGTTVKIYLPRLIGAVAEEKPELPRASTTGSASEAILVVEDDPLVRRLSTDTLRELGYSVFDCSSAAEALKFLDDNPDIKLLFTDVVMPVVNGRKLADEALRRRPDLKVIFTTGYTPNAVVHGGVLDPGVNFLSKPFSVEQLGTKVRSVLDQ